MKKKLLPLLVLAMALCLAFLPGCNNGPSDEELIKENLTAELSKVDASDEEIEEYLEKQAGDDFGQLGLDATEYMKTYLDGYEYSIEDVTVDDNGKTATARVNLKVKSMSNIMSEFEDKWTEKATELITSGNYDEETLYKSAGEILMQCTQESEVVEHEANFDYEKDSDGNWTLSDGADDVMNRIVNG